MHIEWSSTQYTHYLAGASSGSRVAIAGEGRDGDRQEEAEGEGRDGEAVERMTGEEEEEEGEGSTETLWDEEEELPDCRLVLIRAACFLSSSVMRLASRCFLHCEKPKMQTQRNRDKNVSRSQENIQTRESKGRPNHVWISTHTKEQYSGKQHSPNKAPEKKTYSVLTYVIMNARKL